MVLVRIPNRSVPILSIGKSLSSPGDPEDKSLRKVELEVCIPGIVRERAHREKCHDFIDGKELGMDAI